MGKAPLSAYLIVVPRSKHCGTFVLSPRRFWRDFDITGGSRHEDLKLTLPESALNCGVRNLPAVAQGSMQVAIVDKFWHAPVKAQRK
jgi:monoamine oxidase